MKRAVHIRNLIGYSKKGFVYLGVFICAMIHVDLHIAIDKPQLQDLEIDEAFDQLKFETLHPDATINRKAYA